jgi:hypothetical protein
MNERSFLFINMDQPLKQTASNLFKEKKPAEGFLVTAWNFIVTKQMILLRENTLINLLVTKILTMPLMILELKYSPYEFFLNRNHNSNLFVVYSGR